MARYPVATILILSLLASEAAAQSQLVLRTTEGDITIEIFDHATVRRFGSLFRFNYRGSLLHESDKRLACDDESCICAPDQFNCDPCANAQPAEFLCADGLEPDCSCETGAPMYPMFACTAAAGAFMDCPEQADATCTCGDGSTPAFECADLSAPPGVCMMFDVTDDTLPAGALHGGLHALTKDNRVIDTLDYLPDGIRNAPGFFSNVDLTIAFVRSPAPDCELTSEWVINLQDNSVPFDAVPGCATGAGGGAAYLVFGRVVSATTPLTSIATLPVRDLTGDLGTPSATCPGPPAPPSPLTSFITGIPDASRCDPGWDQFALIDFSVEPFPRVNGNCAPGDEACMCDGAVLPCVEKPHLCNEVGEPDTETGLTPCLDPVCADTQMGASGLECTEPLGPNFPLVVPEPGPGALALVALTTLVAVRRLTS